MQRSAHFDWGEVQVDFSVDQSAMVIADVQIASDSLFPDAIEEAKRCLKGASTLEPPMVAGCEHPEILSDIINLIYEKV